MYVTICKLTRLNKVIFWNLTSHHLKKFQVSEYATVNASEEYVIVDLLTLLNRAPKLENFSEGKRFARGGSPLP